MFSSEYMDEIDKLRKENEELNKKVKMLSLVLEKAKDWADDSAWVGREEIVLMIEKVLAESRGKDENK